MASTDDGIRDASLVGAGAVAGGLSALAFAALHQLVINPIWFALPAMVAAGVLCGSCLACGYGLLVSRPTIRSWLRYNTFFVGMFVALGLTSLAAFRPVTTITALLQAQAPPTKLIARAFPLTTGFALAATGLLCVLYRPRWPGALAALVTTALMVLVLGLNISVLGLVAVDGSDWAVLLEVLLFLGALAAVNAGLVVVLRRSRFRAHASSQGLG